jgi:hypothetical protein
MKKLLAMLVILMAFSGAFAQLQVVKQKQITVETRWKFLENKHVYNLGEKGFIFVNEFESKNKSSDYTWKFTLYNNEAETVWTKEIDLNENLTVRISPFEGGLCAITSNMKGSIGNKSDEFIMLKISMDGAIEKKLIQLDESVQIGEIIFINDACYVNATFKKDDAILKFDFSTFTMSKNLIKIPENTVIIDQNSDGKNIYYRVRSLKKNIDYDAIYTIEDGVVTDKVVLERTNYNDIQLIKIVKSDSLHKFALMCKMDARFGNGSYYSGDEVEMQYYISSINGLSAKSFHPVDKATSDLLTKNSTLKIKNKALANSFTGKYKLNNSHYLISNCIRIKDKNILVFEKNQQIYFETSGAYADAGYLITNVIVWCINDEGILEWSKNFECENVSPFMEPKISAVKYDDNSIALAGFFDEKLSIKIFSTSGELLENTTAKKNTTANVVQTDYTGYNFFNLHKDTFLMWGLEGKSTNKNSLNIGFKIVELEK